MKQIAFSQGETVNADIFADALAQTLMQNGFPIGIKTDATSLQLGVYVGEDSTPSGVSAIAIPFHDQKEDKDLGHVVVLRNWQLAHLARQILAQLS